MDWDRKDGPAAVGVLGKRPFDFKTSIGLCVKNVYIFLLHMPINGVLHKLDRPNYTKWKKWFLGLQFEKSVIQYR